MQHRQSRYSIACSVAEVVVLIFPIQPTCFAEGEGTLDITVVLLWKNLGSLLATLFDSIHRVYMHADRPVNLVSTTAVVATFKSNRQRNTIAGGSGQHRTKHAERRRGLRSATCFQEPIARYVPLRRLPEPRPSRPH